MEKTSGGFQKKTNNAKTENRNSQDPRLMVNIKALQIPEEIIRNSNIKQIVRCIGNYKIIIIQIYIKNGENK